MSRPVRDEGETEETAVEAIETAPPDEGAPSHIDEATEAAFLSEARERGEPVRTAASADAEALEDASPKALPKLDELVNRIPSDVRETLEDLFRARFHNVKRVPKKALK